MTTDVDEIEETDGDGDAGETKPIDGSSCRSRLRSTEARAATENVIRISKKQLQVLQEENAQFPWHEYPRPRVRRDCLTGEQADDGRGDGCNAERPCPFVSCKFHLAIDVEATGNIKTIFPDRELDDMVETCALDVADRGGITLDDVGELVNVTRERIRQLESRAMKRLTKRAASLRHLVDEGRTPERDAAMRRALVKPISAAAVSERPKPRPDRENRWTHDPNADWWRDVKPENTARAHRVAVHRVEVSSEYFEDPSRTSVSAIDDSAATRPGHGSTRSPRGSRARRARSASNARATGSSRSRPRRRLQHPFPRRRPRTTRSRRPPPTRRLQRHRRRRPPP